MTTSSSSFPTNPRLALVVIAVVFAILNADITTVNVALVTLGKDLDADLEDLQLGAQQLHAGIRCADRCGADVSRTSLVDAVACLQARFCLRWLHCFAGSRLHFQSSSPDVSYRGAGGAIMLPAGMAIISGVYSGEERAVALGTLVGVAGVAQSIGPLLGGFLTATVSWRLVFLMNLPLIVVIIPAALRAIRESRDENVSRRIDIVGVVILATALTSLLVGLDAAQGSDRNSTTALGLIVLSLALFVAFSILGRRTDNAILDGRLLQLPPFLCSCLASFLLGCVFFLFLFVSAVYLQEVFGYNAFAAGTALVPFSLVLLVSGVMSGRLTKRFQLTTLLIATCISMALGLAILSFVPATYGYAGVVFPFLLVAAGAGPGFTLLNTAGLTAVSSERAGQAAGIIYMFRFGGGAIGVAAASALHDALFRKQLIFRLSETPLSFAQQKLLEQPGAAERISQFDSGLVGSQAEQVRHAFHESLVAAFSRILRLNVIVPIAIGILVVLLLEKRQGRINS